MKVNLRYLLKNHLFNVEYVAIYCNTSFEPVIYDYDVVFTHDIFMDYILDDDKNYWSVCNDGLGVQFLKISPRFQ